MALGDAELCDRYEALYPGAVADSPDELGYERRTLPSAIDGLTHETRVAGIAYPVRGHPVEAADHDENVRRFLRMLGDAPEHSALVYETNDEEAAHLGELSTTALAAGGCRGAVIDGGVRDVRFVLEQGFPVFARYRTPADAPPRWRLDEWGVPARVGGVEVRPGDLVVGDSTAWSVFPGRWPRRCSNVPRRPSEDEIRELVREGVDPLEAFERHGTF